MSNIDRYKQKPTWNGSSLLVLGQVTRDPHILRVLFEEACQLAINEGIAKNAPFVSVKPEHVHKAASIIQRRENARKAALAAITAHAGGVK